MAPGFFFVIVGHLMSFSPISDHEKRKSCAKQYKFTDSHTTGSLVAPPRFCVGVGGVIIP